MSIKILLADDHKIVREGLRSLLEKQPDMEVVAEAKDGRTIVELAMERLPNVVIMDIAMPGLNGIEATHKIIARTPGIKVVALTMHSDRRFIVEMLKAGATGYLLKDCAFEELTYAIRAVVANRTYISPQLADTVIKDYVRFFPNIDFSVFSLLTSREREVLQLLSEGKSTKQIASSLQLSVKTIETYRQQIMDKLDIHSIAELTKYAIREGLTTFEN
ncbi:MAG: response regulator transcription factor [Nitrospirota bacterium]|nr:response regulator transcription factor [Nitrospirota bacterium]